MKLFRVIVITGLLTLLVSSLTPWVSINLLILGRLTFNFIDILNLILNQIPSIGRQLSSSLSTSLLTLSIITYVLSVVTTATGIAFRTSCIVGGVLAMISGTSFITGIYIAKSEATIFKPLEQLIKTLVNIEVGPILTITAGVITLIAYTIKEKQTKN
jgi:uncharacterized membrane protein